MSKERFKCYYCDGVENIIVEDTINNETYIEDNIVNLLNKQGQQIADLESKIAESENEIKTLICDYESRITKNHELMSWLEHKNEELKHHLAEKSKELQECKIGDKNTQDALFSKIQKLEQQLAESKEKYKKAYQEGLLQKQFDKDIEISQLKQQLAEKDKEIEYYKSWFADDDYEKQHQDKISFCIEQLEKVKEFAKSIEEHIYNMYDNTKNTNVVSDYHYAKLTVISNIFKFIDNQIEELKKENRIWYVKIALTN